MPTWENKTCIKCGKTKKETEFFKMKTGNRCDWCKTCLTMHIDNRKPDTFKWILEMFDVPYIESVWVEQTNKQYQKNPGKFGPASVIGQYIRTMNMAQYADFHYKDSDQINNRERLAAQGIQEVKEIDPNYEENLRKKYEAGEITKAAYETLSLANAGPHLDEEIPDHPFTYEDENGEETLKVDVPQFRQDIQLNYENSIVDQLSDADMQYLLVKWGVTYTPTEWVKLENTYQKYASEYELNVDREESLIQICKVNLKMDKALDVEDYQGYQKLANVFDQMRKAAKFTEAQNKEEQTRDIDSLGELVAFVEREGGIIPQYDDPIEYPQDKVDFTIKDMKNYVNRLVREELGLGDLIESYIENLKKKKDNSVEEIMNSSFDEADNELTHEEERSFTDFYMEEIEKDSLRLAEGDLDLELEDDWL